MVTISITAARWSASKRVEAFQRASKRVEALAIADYRSRHATQRAAVMETGLKSLETRN